jgi:dolichol-phosphate mannosyltransferase
MSTNISISVVIPAKDEAGNIAELFREIHDVLHQYRDFEIVLVDDGSDDQTLETACSVAASLACAFQGIRHRISVGQSSALRSGIDAARHPWIITMDGDGQNDPADIPRLLQQAATVTQVHFCIAGFRKNRRDTAWKKLQSRLANRVRNGVLRDGVPDTGCGLKLFPRATFIKLPWFDHIHRFLPALIRGLGGDIRVVDVNHRPRRAGVSKYSAWNRAWVGIVDLLGVFWLLHRCPIPEVVDHISEEQF